MKSFCITEPCARPDAFGWQELKPVVVSLASRAQRNNKHNGARISCQKPWLHLVQVLMSWVALLAVLAHYIAGSQASPPDLSRHIVSERGGKGSWYVDCGVEGSARDISPVDVTATGSGWWIWYVPMGVEGVT